MMLMLLLHIEEYVTCHTCRSPETNLHKETRLFFLQCETCGSRCSVQNIKSGFQAVTGKRAQMRSKAQWPIFVKKLFYNCNETVNNWRRSNIVGCHWESYWVITVKSIAWGKYTSLEALTHWLVKKVFNIHIWVQKVFTKLTEVHLVKDEILKRFLLK